LLELAFDAKRIDRLTLELQRSICAAGNVWLLTAATDGDGEE